jgi:hypothetical protein
MVQGSLTTTASQSALWDRRVAHPPEMNPIVIEIMFVPLLFGNHVCFSSSRQMPVLLCGCVLPRLGVSPARSPDYETESAETSSLADARARAPSRLYGSQIPTSFECPITGFLYTAGTRHGHGTGRSCQRPWTRKREPASLFLPRCCLSKDMLRIPESSELNGMSIASGQRSTRLPGSRIPQACI